MDKEKLAKAMDIVFGDCNECPYEGLEEIPASQKAKERVQRPAYQARGLTREQGRQMERMSADKYLESKLNKRG